MTHDIPELTDDFLRRMATAPDPNAGKKMTQIAPEVLARIGPETVIGCDSLQWILFLKRTDLPGASTPLAYCRSKTGLERVIAENGLALSAEGRKIIDGLPEIFEQAKAPANAGQWMDE